MISAWILIFVGNWIYNVPASNVGEFYSQTTCEVAKKEVMEKNPRYQFICVHNGGKEI